MTTELPVIVLKAQVILDVLTLMLGKNQEIMDLRTFYIMYLNKMGLTLRKSLY